MLPGRDMFARTFGEHRGERSGDVRLPDPTRPDPTRYITPTAPYVVGISSVQICKQTNLCNVRERLVC